MKKIIMLLITFSTVLSCSKNENDIGSPKTIAGHYVALDGLPGTKTVYIDDKTISLLNEDQNYLTRSRNDVPYEVVSETEILFNTIPFSVLWEGNKLTLSYSTIKYVLLKEPSTPTAEEWVTTVDPVSNLEQSSFVKGNSFVDLAYYNGYVYTSGHQDLNGKFVISKINPSDFSITNIPIPAGNITSLGYGRNIEYVGSNKFWVYQWGSSEDNMYEFDIITLERTNTILMPNRFGHLYQLGANGTAVYGAFKDEIRKWDFIDKKWGNKIQLGTDYTDGLDLDDKYLYVGKRGIIHKYSLNSLKAVASYNVSMNKRYSLDGFTLTGNNKIVATVYNYDTKKDEIVTINLP